MTRGYVRRHYPLGPQRVTFRAEDGRAVRRVRALRAGRDLDFQQDGRAVAFEVPAVVDYEVVALT
jgi:hypothetical protein